MGILDAALPQHIAVSLWLTVPLDLMIRGSVNGVP